MARILFVVHDLHQHDNHFPLGIGYLASAAAANGHDIDVICQDVFHYSDDYIAASVLDKKPDIIALGFLAARFSETALPLCRKINEVKGNGKLMIGGHGPTGCPEYMLEATGADIVVVGEGESVFDERVGMRSGVIKGQETKKLDSLQMPVYQEFPVDEYKRMVRLPGWQSGDFTLGITASRGCKGKCTFCQRLCKGLRFRSMERVVDEIAFLYYGYGINYIFFQDEMFVASKKRMFEFHDELKKKNLLGKIKFGGDSRVEVIDEEMLECLKDSGIQFLDFGFESMDETVLKLMHKGTTPEQNERCAALTKKAKIPFNMNILWGMPGDSLESLDKDMEFIKRFNDFNFLRTIRPPTPYPGCALFDMAVNDGLLKGPGDFFEKFKNSDLMTVNFTDMPDDEVYSALWRANNRLITMYHGFKAGELKAKFHRLYFNNDSSFRGARHYA